MKTCNKCGANNLETAIFCRECGNDMLIQVKNEDEEENIEKTEQEQQQMEKSGLEKKDDDKKIELHKEPKERNDAICPFCHEPECKPVSLSETETKTKGYKWGNGCCGMFLLGPFGFLCGLCGTGSKTKTTTELRWVCTKCGKDHIALKTALDKWDTFVSSIPIVGLSSGVAAAVLKIIFTWLSELIFGTGFIGGIVKFIVAVILPLFIAVSSPVATVAQQKNNISEELGEDLDIYLTEELSSKAKKMTVISTVIAIAVTLLGLPVLRMIFG